MNLIPLLLALLCLVPQGPVANPPAPDSTVSTAEFGFAAIDRALEQAVADGDIPGHSALIFHKGKVVYSGQFGQRNRELDLPMERDTVFRIYSMTKPITSVAAMQLVESGKLKLDEPVASYLPAFADLKVLKRGKLIEPRRPMKVRDLMRHTSGLTYGFFGSSPVDKEYLEKGVLITDKNLEEMVQKLSTIPLLSHPQLRFHYSVSTDVLARVIEVVSGEEFSAYLKPPLFEPLGMRDTFFTVPKDKRDRLAELYEPGDEGLQLAPKSDSNHFLRDTGFHSGGGGLCSTIDDYLQFCRMLIQKGQYGQKTLLQPESLDQMFRNQLEDVRYSASWFQFGLGFYLDPAKGDFSWSGTAGTSFWVNPKRGLVILYMAQIKPWGQRDMADRVRDMTYAMLADE